MNHTFEVHKGCGVAHCPICDGGLSCCTVCGCLEGSLPTECPGFNCYATHGDAIYAGEIDFKNGAWVAGASENSPAAHRKKS